MQDEQTGTYWQQITGLAVSGPLTGRRLPLVSSDELTFALWKIEQPSGTVLADVPRYVKEYAPQNWDVKMEKAPTVLNYAQAGLKPRDLMFGIQTFGGSRAFLYATVLKERLIEDRVGSEPVLLVVGPDGRSVRAFRRCIPGSNSTTHFYRMVQVPGDRQQTPPVSESLKLMDAESGSEWNFQGCAIAGKLAGLCLDHMDVIKDYWFDWRHYHPGTTVYGIKQRIH